MKASRYIIFRKQREANEKAARPLSFLSGLGLLSLALILILLTAGGMYYAVYSQRFPSLELFKNRYDRKPEPTRFYARDGEKLLFTLAYENFESRDLRFCEEDGDGCFPQTFIKAAEAAHGAGNPQSRAYAAADQMVGQVYAEAISASRFPEFTKKQLSRQVLNTFGEEQILSWYYNRAWFGQMAFGLDAASRLYLDKPGDSLSDAECVLLSAIIEAPMLNPIDSNGALRDSYLGQLALLHRAGLFTDEETESLARSNFTIFEPPRYKDSAVPDIITRKALDAVIHTYGREQVERGGLRVITSEDTSLQRYIECVTMPLDEGEVSYCPLSQTFSEEELRSAAEALRTAPVSAALLDVNTGELLAAVEAQADNENRRIYQSALQSYPIGSGMNYFAALTAFSGGSAPSTLLWDLENSYEAGSAIAEKDPESWQGPLQLREALVKDHQRPLTAHLRAFGSGAVQRNAALFGLNNTHLISDDDILYEGSSASAEAFAFSLIPFAEIGEQTGTNASGAMHPVTILSVERDSGEIDDPQPEARKSLIAGNLAYLVHHIFSQNNEGFSLPDRPAAVKIGKVSGEESLWISGYTTQISCAMRIGPSRNVSAFVTDTDKVRDSAEVLWRSVMEYAHRALPASGWETPADVSLVKVCLPSGKLPTAACPETVTEVFLRGSEPYEYDEYYAEVPINRENLMLATRFTPPESVEKAVFINLPEDASIWAAENGIEQVPTEYDPIRAVSRGGAVQFEEPEIFQAFSQDSGEKIDVIVRLSLQQLPDSFQVSIGSGMYPEEWTEVCSGGALENGQWLLCSLDPAGLDQGLYVLRAGFALPEQRYRSSETYFSIE